MRAFWIQPARTSTETAEKPTHSAATMVTTIRAMYMGSPPSFDEWSDVEMTSQGARM